MFCKILVAVVTLGLIQASDWKYDGEDGPFHWNEHFKKCEGDEQSPINLDSKSAIANSFDDFDMDTLKNMPTKMELINNGHAAQVNLDAPDYIVSGGGLDGEYKVDQFHFHFGHNDDQGSEHTVNGDYFPMEMHIVMHSTKYSGIVDALKDPAGLAVLGFFFEVAPNSNKALKTLIKALKFIKKPRDHEGHGDRVALKPFPLYDLIQGINKKKFYRYHGSLTTPTCDEAVVWTVFSEPIAIKEKQLKAFRRLRDTDKSRLMDNFRPIQPVNGRVITHCT